MDERHGGGMILEVEVLEPTAVVAAAALRPRALVGQVDWVVFPTSKSRTGGVGLAGGAVHVSPVTSLHTVG